MYVWAVLWNKYKFLQDGRSGRTILHYAVESGKLDLVQFLVQHCDADVNCQTFDGATPLRLAVGRRHMNVASYLINVGADAAVLHTETYEESDEVCSTNYPSGNTSLISQNVSFLADPTGHLLLSNYCTFYTNYNPARKLKAAVVIIE